MSINAEIKNFFHKQSFVMVATANSKGKPNISAKGIVKIENSGYVYLLDLYDGRTHKNLKENSKIAISAIDEHKFTGWQLKGRAERIIYEGNEFEKMLPLWERQVIGRVSKNIIRSIQKGITRSGRSEAELPKPKYLIKMKVNEIIDLAPKPREMALKE